MDMAEPRMIPVEKLIPNEWNPNVMSSKDYDRLVEEIRSVGFIDFPQVVPLKDGFYQILGGEHRVRAAKDLGIGEVPCAVLRGDKWDDTDLKKLVTVRLNVLHGKVDPTRMALLYNEMAEKYGAEALQEVFAYTDNAGWKSLVKSLEKAVGDAGLDPERSKKFKEGAREAKTVDDLTRILQQLFANYGDTVSHSFMVFTHGNQEHIYVNMDRKTHAGMKRVMKYCTDSGKDINTVLGVAVQALADSLQLSGKKKATKPSEAKF